MKKTVAVIGAGAAGLIAAGVLAERGKDVKLIEKNAVLGKKIRITGKGRCNITNIDDIENILKNIPTNPKFLYSALYSFTNMDLIHLLNSMGLKTKVERGGRVFPESDNAKDVVDALKKYALKANVEVICAFAEHLLFSDGKITGVSTSAGKIYADSVIVATGGKSYPLTGSTGDGYRLAEEVGHTIIEPKPSLVPIVTEERWVSDLMGLSLKNVELTVYNKKNKRVFSDFGEMLFTHFGISGPIVLSASAHLKDIHKEEYRVCIDLKPALDIQQLDRRIQRDFEKYTRKHLINAMDDLLPKALIPVIVELSGISPHKEVNQITREERMRLVELFKSLTLRVKDFRPIEEAIVTSGGIKVGEINPSTMESKLLAGLYFAGEVIDVDAYTGGYNLQIAFSTGYLAGKNA
ncbi:MAG: NAD(P)/FAD-dependent oxidoreductase [Clostridia bacterium]|nr:NAD(P)/FAD-dependent oxidoreductase [Clostridia bacterium]